MNSTNRAANRLLIVCCGLLLLMGGAIAAGGVLVPAIRDEWNAATGHVDGQMSHWLQQTPVGTTGVSWMMPALCVLLFVAVIVLVVFIARQGRGRTGNAVTEPASDRGATIIDSAVAEHTLQDALDGRPEFVASHVSTYRVRRTPVLKVAVTCRRGISPRDAATHVEDALCALDDLLGRELPAMIQISGGFRSRMTTATRFGQQIASPPGTGL